jgi:hypothetical protein
MTYDPNRKNKSKYVDENCVAGSAEYWRRYHADPRNAERVKMRRALLRREDLRAKLATLRERGQVAQPIESLAEIDAENTRLRDELARLSPTRKKPSEFAIAQFGGEENASVVEDMDQDSYRRLLAMYKMEQDLARLENREPKTWEELIKEISTSESNSNNDPSEGEK